MISKPAQALLIATLLFGGRAVQAQPLDIEYRISLAGLTLGQASLEGRFEEGRYKLLMNLRLTGIAGLLSRGGRGSATSAGSVADRRLEPSGFSATGKSGSAERTVQVGFDSGAVTAIAIKPPFEPQPDRVPLTDRDKRGVIDPLSAAVVAAADPAKPIEAANCDRRLPVFDGTQRFDVMLSYADTKKVRLSGYSGDVLVCNARYVPIAGHRRDRPDVKFMEQNRAMSVWLAPFAGTRILVPVRISVETMLGTTLIEVQSWAGQRPHTPEPSR